MTERSIHPSRDAAPTCGWEAIAGQINYRWRHSGAGQVEVWRRDGDGTRCRVGVIRLEQDTATVHGGGPVWLACDRDGEEIASGPVVADLALLIAVCDRSTHAAARQAEKDLAEVIAREDLDTATWQRCIGLDGHPAWPEEFGAYNPLGGAGGGPTLASVLRDLGLNPDQHGPDSDLGAAVSVIYERAFELAWHSAFLRAAHQHLQT